MVSFQKVPNGNFFLGGLGVAGYFMNFLVRFYSTSVGKKITMALSGLIMVGFVIAHMLGNLKVFAGFDLHLGQYKIDHYAEALEGIAADFLGHETFLWIARIVLLGALILHVVSAILVTRQNRLAKPVANSNAAYASSTVSSRTMFWGGLFLLAFIIFHILHFTTGDLHFRGFVEHRVYSNIYLGFQSGPVVIFYLVAMTFLALHLYHGTWSVFQTLGIDSPTLNGPLRAAVKVVVVLLFLGFVSVPIAAYSGLLQPPLSQTCQAEGACQSKGACQADKEGDSSCH